MRIALAGRGTHTGVVESLGARRRAQGQQVDAPCQPAGQHARAMQPRWLHPSLLHPGTSACLPSWHARGRSAPHCPSAPPHLQRVCQQALLHGWDGGEGGHAAQRLCVPVDATVQQLGHKVERLDQLVQLGHVQAAAVRDAQDAAHLPASGRVQAAQPAAASGAGLTRVACTRLLWLPAITSSYPAPPLTVHL